MINCYSPILIKRVANFILLSQLSQDQREQITLYEDTQQLIEQIHSLSNLSSDTKNMSRKLGTLVTSLITDHNILESIQNNRAHAVSVLYIMLNTTKKLERVKQALSCLDSLAQTLPEVNSSLLDPKEAFIKRVASIFAYTPPEILHQEMTQALIKDGFYQSNWVEALKFQLQQKLEDPPKAKFMPTPYIMNASLN